jgi:hypothetical protein
VQARTFLAHAFATLHLPGLPTRRLARSVRPSPTLVSAELCTSELGLYPHRLSCPIHGAMYFPSGNTVEHYRIEGCGAGCERVLAVRLAAQFSFSGV